MNSVFYGKMEKGPLKTFVEENLAEIAQHDKMMNSHELTNSHNSNSNDIHQADINPKMIEEYFDKHKDIMNEIFMKRANLVLINKWLLTNGYSPLSEYVPYPTKRGSLSNENSKPSSPLDKGANEVFFENRHARSNSKKYLRQEYSKSKRKNMCRTFEPTSGVENTIESRRNSLKEMRMFRSLPPSSMNMLSMLIQSKVRLPRYPSKDIDLKRELRHQNEREFFLEIVKDISNDLDLRSLTAKMVTNSSILVDGDTGSVFVVEDRNNGGHGTLVSKVFDVHSGAHILPTPSSDGSITVPWGKGIIGYVAETRETVNLTDASQVGNIVL